jgi:hypothetical protein
MSGRTFVVGVYVGRRIVSWPFGRLDVNSDSLSVRSRPAFQLRRREAFKGSIEGISIERRSGTTFSRFATLRMHSQVLSFRCRLDPRGSSLSFRDVVMLSPINDRCGTSIGCNGSLFNWPKLLVPPSLRPEPGIVETLVQQASAGMSTERSR